jgi:hypothetical protein
VTTAVEFALIGDPAEPGARISDEDWSRPWDERARIQLDVDDNDSLGSVVDRVLSEFGVVLADEVVPAHVVNVALVDDEADRVGTWDLTLVDDEGRVIWTAYDLRLVPYWQLVRAVEAGAVRGDPRRLYVILKEPIGDGLGIDWPTILDAWRIVDEIVMRIGGYAGAAAGLAGAYQYVRHRLEAGREAVARNAPRWAQRGGHPYDVFRLLASRGSWSAQDLATLLGCSEDDAVSVLALYGFGYNEADGRWRQDADDAARVLSVAFEEASAMRFELSDAHDEFAARVEQLVRTGERPPNGPTTTRLPRRSSRSSRLG